MCQCPYQRQLFASVSVFFNYTIQYFHVRYLMTISFFGEIIEHIIAKWRHYDVFTISVSAKNEYVPPHLCTQTDTLKEGHRHWLLKLNLLFSVSVLFTDTDTDTDEIKRCGTHLSQQAAADRQYAHKCNIININIKNLQWILHFCKNCLTFFNIFTLHKEMAFCILSVQIPYY